MQTWKNSEKPQMLRKKDTKTKFHCSNVWTAEQDKMVLEHLITDTELSKIIQHSVKAIQVRRCRLKKKNKEGVI